MFAVCTFLRIWLLGYDRAALIATGTAFSPLEGLQNSGSEAVGASSVLSSLGFLSGELSFYTTENLMFAIDSDSVIIRTFSSDNLLRLEPFRDAGGPWSQSRFVYNRASPWLPLNIVSPLHITKMSKVASAVLLSIALASAQTVYLAGDSTMAQTGANDGSTAGPCFRFFRLVL